MIREADREDALTEESIRLWERRIRLVCGGSEAGRTRSGRSVLRSPVSLARPAW